MSRELNGIIRHLAINLSASHYGLAKTAAASELVVVAGRLHSVKRPERLRCSAPQARFADADAVAGEFERPPHRR
jgi:hypothetical protein